MPGYNLATLFEEFRAGYNGTARAPIPMPDVTDAEAFRLINEGYLYFQKRLKVELTRNTSVALTSGTATYTLPQTRLARSIHDIRLVNSDGDGEIKLQHITPQAMRDLFYLDSTSTDTGDPAYWCYSESTNGQIIIRPVPTWTASGGIRIYHAPMPIPLERIYFPTAATVAATATNGSASITLNKGTSTISDIATKIQAGDEFGIIETTNFDGAAPPVTANEAVAKWYSISTVTAGASSTTLTLAESWTGLAKSSVRFITAQVSEIEKAMPGFLGFVPAYRALWLRLQRTKPDVADQYRAMVDEFLNDFSMEDPGTDNYGHVNTPQFSWMNL